jgi:hypothetical protein
VDTDPAFFVIDLEDANQKQIFKESFCLLGRYIFKVPGTLGSLFKEKKSPRSCKTVGIKVFLTIFL